MNNKLTIKDSSLAFIFSFIICQLTAILAAFIALFLASAFNVENTEAFLNTCCGYLIISSALYLAMFFIFTFFNKNKENKIFLKPSVKKLFIYILVAIASFVLLYPIINSCDTLLNKLGFKSSSLSYELNLTNYLISIVPIVLLPAICEELLFRGLIFKGLNNKSKNFAICLSSIMFAIYHMSIYQTLYPVLFGLLLAAVMHKENNLFYCMAMHATNNFIALTLQYLNVSFVFNHVGYYLIAILFVVIFVGLLILFIKKQKNNTSSSTITKSDKIFIFLSCGAMLIFWIISNIII